MNDSWRLERIVVVDDDASTRFLIREILVAAKFQVVECANGQEALDEVQRVFPSLVLMDISMPVMDGIEACRCLRKAHSLINLPIMMVTSTEEAAILPQALKAGANDYVAKPINRLILLARVNNLLSIRKSQQETERLLEIQATTADALPQALAIVSKEERILHANKVWVEGCGGSISSSIAEAYKMIFGGALHQIFLSLTHEILEAPKLALDREFSIESGPLRHVQIISRPIETRSGEELRLWIIRDITHTRELERSINERVRLDSVGLLIKGVAHNFNNILGGIVGAVELLEKYVPDEPRAQRAMSIVKKGAKSAAALTKKLGIFSDREASNIAMLYEQLEEVLDAILIIQQEKVGERVRIALSTPRPLPKVKMVVTHLIEIINNIISNAVDAIEGEGRIEIFVEPHVGIGKLSIAFKDSGVGMEPEMVRRVFEPFFTTKNLDVRNSVSIDGHGLGLWNVYNLVRKSGGDVTVDSQLGKGTTVTVTLLTEDAHTTASHE